ncbi:hypothetical protein [Arenibaculum pallidiluteum]|uniref:hypothetical protein n=1 Tax=Arenibaculum pallidiluteum TaxID=2812559 RepID=UPI001A958197|nr:hypothetical protein [Arenibaculum pallidiluteum]
MAARGVGQGGARTIGIGDGLRGAARGLGPGPGSGRSRAARDQRKAFGRLVDHDAAGGHEQRAEAADVRLAPPQLGASSRSILRPFSDARSCRASIRPSWSSEAATRSLALAADGHGRGRALAAEPAAAAEVLSAAGGLAKEAETLRADVNGFIAVVRAA